MTRPLRIILQQIQPHIRMRNINPHRQPCLIQQFRTRSTGNFNPINLYLHLFGRLQDDNPFVWVFGVAEYALIFFEPCIYFVGLDLDVVFQVTCFD